MLQYLMIVGLHHIALSVPDLDAAVAFYIDHLGFTEAFTGGWDGDRPDNDRVIGLDRTVARVAMLRHTNAYIELWEYHHPEPRPLEAPVSPADHGLAHFCLQVTDIAAEYERLSAAGMTFHAAPVRLGASAAIYGRDPFGTIIELYEVSGPHGLESTRSPT
jgi:catechol 2,3-dioxygenase-like lactoylglutathione lyase family enzyme